jgi:ATP-dependent DNA helicase RecG
VTDAEMEQLLDALESDRSVARGVRIGPRRAIASRQEERILAERRRHRDAPFDVYPLREADIGELDADLFREVYLPAAVSPAVLAENRRSPDEQMASLRLLDLGPPPVPTVLGLLAVGRRPRWHLPMAYVSFIRFAGAGLASEVVTAHDLHGPLPRLMSQIDELLRLHIMTRVDITSADTERQQPDYPLPATGPQHHHAPQLRGHQRPGARLLVQ